MSEKSNSQKSLPLWRRITFMLIVLMIAGLAVIMLADFLVAKSLDSKITAINKAGFPISFEQLAPAMDPISTEEASKLYTSALNQLPMEDMEILIKILAAYRTAIDADALDKLPQELRHGIASILKQHQSSLTALDNAATLPLSQFDIELRYGKDAYVKSLNKIQKALTILSLRTTFLLGAKQYDLSAKSIITMLKATRVFDTYPTLLVSRAKQHFLKLACDDIRLLLSHGQPSDSILDKISIALTDAIRTDNIKDSLLAEQVYQIEASRNLFSEKLITNFFLKNVPDMPERANLPTSSLGKIKLRYFISQYFNAIGNLIEASSKPMPELLKYVSANKEKASGRIKPAISILHNHIENSLQSVAIARSTVLALHIEKYKYTNGSIPGSLEEIADDIEPMLRTDPFSGSNMLYKRDEQSYTIYSTGLDGIDNDGSTRTQTSHDTGKIEKEPEDVGLRIIITKE